MRCASRSGGTSGTLPAPHALASARAVDGDRQPGGRSRPDPEAAPGARARRERGRHRVARLPRAGRADEARARRRRPGPRPGRVRRRRPRHRGHGRRRRHGPAPRDRPHRRGERLRPRARLRPQAAAARLRCHRERRRPRRRPRTRERTLVHLRHRVRLRRGGQPVGEHRPPPLRHHALRRGRPADPRRLQTPSVPSDRRRRNARHAAPGSWR